MNLLGRLTHVRLRWHLLLVSFPCAWIGLLIAYALGMAWYSRTQPSGVFLVAAVSWALMWVWGACAALMLANTWRTAGAKGLRAKATWLQALVIVSGFQAAAAMAMFFAMTGWVPEAFLYAPLVVLFGAPWASVGWHLRWLGRGEAISPWPSLPGQPMIPPERVP